MNADEIDKVQNDYDTITTAIGKAIKEDRELITNEGWVGHLCDADTVTRFAVNGKRDTLFVNFCVYTQMTGGSYEYPEAEIPLDTLNKYL
jgi:hypothetical protein